MKFGVIITGGSVHEQIDLARTAEAAGWDGVFTWDGIHVGDSMEVHDPWVLMSAFAMATQRVRIGAIIQPLARRRPWKVARATWWIESNWESFDPAVARRRIEAGPPRQ